MPPAAPAATQSVSQPRLILVMLPSGGKIVGTLLAEEPGRSLTVQTAAGTTQQLAVSEILKTQEVPTNPRERAEALGRTVLSKKGTLYRGELVAFIPRESISLLLGNGAVVRVAADDILQVGKDTPRTIDATAAGAAPPKRVRVLLTDGSIFPGELALKDSATEVEVRLLTGELRSVPWEKVQQIEQPGFAPPPPEVIPDDFIRVHLAGNVEKKEQLALFAQDWNSTLIRIEHPAIMLGPQPRWFPTSIEYHKWQPACWGECGIEVARTRRLRVVVQDIGDSDAFTLEKVRAPEATVLVDAHRGSRGAMAAGIVLSALGGLAFMGGFSTLLLGVDSQERSGIPVGQQLALRAGVASLVLGAAALAGGIPLTVRSRSRVTFRILP